MVQHVNPKEGLSLLINYGMPMENTPEIKLLVHEPGMAPDVNSFHTSVVKLKKSYYEHIAISATQIQTTVDFDNMSYKSRNCIILNCHIGAQRNCDFFHQSFAFLPTLFSVTADRVVVTCCLPHVHPLSEEKVA